MKRILSIDGGGIRGIWAAVILAELEQRMRKPCQRIFDLIAGTSTGGIIALALAMKRADGEPMYSAADLVDLYEQRGAQIFSRPWWRLGVTMGKYASGGVEDVLRLYFKDAVLSQAAIGVIATAYDIEGCVPYLFASYRAAQSREHDYEMWQVARSTSAAPTFFEPFLAVNANKRGRAFVDGGVCLNNPTMSAVSEAAEIWPEKKPLVLSIGTGDCFRPTLYSSARKWGVAKWAKPVFGIVMDGVSAATHHQAKAILGRSYMRIQDRLPDDLTAMDQPKNATLLRKAAEQWIDRNGIDSVCEALEA